MDNQSFSLVRAVPGMQRGATVRNGVLVLLAPTLVLVWPFVAAYAVGTDRGGSARALQAIPGIGAGGGSVAAVAAFTWTALALALALAPLAIVSPSSLSLWLALALPVLYLLAVGYGATQSVALLGAWWRLRNSGTDPSALAPGPVQLSGTAEPVAETVDAPFSETESIAHVSGRYKHTGAVDPGTLDSSTWGLTDRESAAVPFTIGDRVVVDATPEAVSIERSRQSIVGDESDTPTERLPDEVEDDTVAASAVDPSGPTGYVEQRIEPGEAVTVSGIAVPAGELDAGMDTVPGRDADADTDLVITGPSAAPDRLVGDVPLPLVITDDATNAGATDLLQRAVALLVLTVLLAVPLVVSPLPARLLAFLGL